MPVTAHGRASPHFGRPKPPGRTAAVAVLREVIGDLHREASFMARNDNEAADNLRAEAERLQAAIEILQRR